MHNFYVVLLLVMAIPAISYIPLVSGIDKRKTIVSTFITTNQPQQVKLFASNTDDEGSNKKWEASVDEWEEKVESVKIAVVSGIGGSLAILPYAIVKG